MLRIDEVVISANKWEQNKSEIPFEILSIDAGLTSFANPQTSADLLEATGQVFVQKSQLGGGSPMIRGFGANSVLIVVDGVRMNNTIFRSGNLQNVINIDPNVLESSEVIFGPGAVIYGSDALGGVMDFHTKKPSFSDDKTAVLSGQMMARYSSENKGKTASALIKVGGNKVAYLGSFTFSDFDDLLTGSVRIKANSEFGKRPEYVERINETDSVLVNKNENLQRFSGFSSIGTLQKVSMRIKDELQIGYTFHYSSTSNIPRYDRLTEYDGGQLKYASWYYGPQKWMMNALHLHSAKPVKLFDALKVTVAHQLFEESRHDRRFKEATLRNRLEKVNVFTCNADLEKAINPSSHLFYGLEYAYNHVSSSAHTRNVKTDLLGPLSTRYPAGSSNVHTAAFYISYKRAMMRRLFLSTGLRFSYQDLLSRFEAEQFAFDDISNKNSALNGNIGLVFKPDDRWNVSTMVSSGFRAPNVDDISKVFDSEPGRVLVPNPELRPEYSYNFEISATRLIKERFKLSATYFYSFLRDAMVRGDFTFNGKDSIYYDGELSKVQTIVNTGRANIYGFSLGFIAELNACFSSSINLNYTQGRDLVQDEPLRHTTPLFGNVSIRYARKKLDSEFFLRFNGNRKFENLPPSERNKPHLYAADGSPAWYTLNLRTSYQLSGFLLATAALENILDHHYRTYSSGISAPGRNFVFSLRAKF